jgi:hypothetical protein
MVNILNENGHMSGPLIKWISGECRFTCLFSCIHTFPSDFTHRCLSAPESDGGVASKAARHDNTPILHHATLNSPTPTPLLREWANATLASRSWKDALVTAANVRISSPFILISFMGLMLLVWSSSLPNLPFIGPYVNAWKGLSASRMRPSVFTQWQTSWHGKCRTRGQSGFSVSDRTYEADGIYVTILCQNLNLIAARN